MKIIFNFFFTFLILSFYSYILPQSSTSFKLKNDALALMNTGRYGEAIDQWNKYISENPQSAEAFNLRGFCYEKRDDYENAVYDYKTAKKLSPSDNKITSNLNRATNNWYKLLYNNIEGYKREIAINPNLPKNYLQIGKCYKNLGKWTEAEIWYDSYLEKQEASADEILRYTEILAMNNHIAKGIPILKSFTEKYPTDHRLWSKYGYFLMWLGKNKEAIQAFTEALEFRPYFKEAIDGMDLAKGKGYVYSINDTTSKFNYGLRGPGKEYVIDKYYRLIKKNPEDSDLRFKLIEELLKVKRFEEASQQLKYLSFKFADDKKYKDLYDKVMMLKKSYYAEKIKYYQDLLSKNPENKKALLELGKFYSYNSDYDLAQNIYKTYLENYPSDSEVRYKLVELLTWQNDLCEAKTEAEKLLKSAPDNSGYQLILANIDYWLDKDLDQSEELLTKVISKNPDKTEALTTLINLNIRNKNLVSAETLIQKLEKLEPENEQLSSLKDNINKLQILIENEKNQKLIDDARKSMSDGNYDSAIENFKKYLLTEQDNKNASLELADAYLKKSYINDAIKIYDELLSEHYDFDIAMQKAKTLYWAGDSLSALNEFRTLNQRDPNDVEAKLFLGDAYLKTGQIQNAKRIYEELLSQSPNSHIIKTRLGWIGSGYKSFAEGIGNFIQVVPQAYYFTDNTEFKLNNIGLGLNVGITNSVTLGISGFRGALFSKNDNLRFNQIKGTAYFKLNNILSGAASFGQTYFTNNKKENIIDVSLNAVKKNVYNLTGYFNYSDAAFILYSPFLVNNRLNAYLYGFNAEYRFKNNFMISGKFSEVDVSDKNNGQQVQARVGKYFEDDISAGYEYYYYTFKFFSDLYWSPKNFESHSVWIDWNLFTDQTTSFKLGGKVGMIPQNDYVLSEFYAAFDYVFTSSLSFKAKLMSGSSSRSNVGYRSTAIQAGIFWNL